MSSDRGTISRGTGASPDGAWAEPTAPAGRRLPSAPRERKPALAALAVVLVVGGALAATLLVTDASHKAGAIEISQAVGQGQKIPLASMQEVQVTSGSGIDYVPWDEASQVAQTYASTMIPAGTLLTPQMTTSVNNLAKGKTVVGLALKDGQLPDGLQVGNRITIFETSDANGRCPRPPDNVLSSGAVVINISHAVGSATDAVDDVQVGVDPADAASVSCNAANNDVSVGILPSSGGQPPSAPSSGGGTTPSSGPSTSPSGGTG